MIHGDRERERERTEECRVEEDEIQYQNFEEAIEGKRREIEGTD